DLVFFWPLDATPLRPTTCGLDAAALSSRRSERHSASVAGMSSPPLSKLRHCAERFKRPVPGIAGSRWPPALIQNPQASRCAGVRLDGLVILWWPAAVCGE